METGWKRKKNWDHMSSSSSVFLHIARWVFSLRHKSPVWQGQRSVQDRICSKQMHPFMHTDFLCKYKQGLAKNQKTSGLWNKLELIHSCLPIQIALQTSLAVLQHGQSSKYLSVVRIAKHAEWRWLHRVEVWPNMHPSVSLTLPLIC
jgi:hypothetical protein